MAPNPASPKPRWQKPTKWSKFLAYIVVCAGYGFLATEPSPVAASLVVVVALIVLAVELELIGKPHV